MASGPIPPRIARAIWIDGDSRKRARQLTRHFLSTPAIPGFAWIKELELLVLGAPIDDQLRMIAGAIVLTLAWVITFDDVAEAVDEAKGDA